jgi:hypothetical protein
LSQIENEEVIPGRSERIKNQSRSNYYAGIIYNENRLLYTNSEFEEIPKAYDEIEHRIDKDLWFKTIEDELESHGINNTWSLVNNSNEKNIID